MRYEMTLVGEDGRRFQLSGEKTLHHGSVRRAWQATTTLAVHVTDEHGAPRSAPAIMRVESVDFARQLRDACGSRVPHAGGRPRAALARFTGLFTTGAAHQLRRRAGRELRVRHDGLRSERRSAAPPARRDRVVPGRRHVDRRAPCDPTRGCA